MANAIHKTKPGDTLRSVSLEYYALGGPDGRIDEVALKKVTSAIRKATSPAISDLTGIGDNEVLPPGSELRIPTDRSLNRVIVTDKEQLAADLKKKGFDHARSYLRYLVDQVIEILDPFPPEYSKTDVERSWTMTAFFNLDGVDRFSAEFLFMSTDIRSLEALAGETAESLRAILNTMVTQHGRPASLLEQRHEERWPLEARILTRKRVSELTKAKARMFHVPFAPAEAERAAEFFESITSDDSFTAAEAALASKLAKLHRFQAAVLRGNLSVSSGQWSAAVEAYQEARRQCHRLAEELGVVATVDDEHGINLNTAIQVSQRLLQSMPGEDDTPLRAPPLKLRSGDRQSPYRLRSFVYSDLHPGAQQRLRASLASAPVHQMPAKFRSSVQQAVLEKTRAELADADPRLVEGLIQGAGTTLMRDLETQDRKVLWRNLGSTSVEVLYADGPNQETTNPSPPTRDRPLPAPTPAATLGVFDNAGDALAISEIPSPWDATTPVVSILSDAARQSYPSTLINRVNASTKFVVLPSEGPDGGDVFLPLTETFVEDYETQILKPRQLSKDGDALAFDALCWKTPAFAAIIPWLYAAVIPLSLRQAYSHLGQQAEAYRHGRVRTNVYAPDGSLRQNLASVPPSSIVFDASLYACSERWDDSDAAQNITDLSDMEEYTASQIALADHFYSHDDRDNARATYADVKCAIDSYLQSRLAEMLEDAQSGVIDYHNAINDGQINGGYGDVSHFSMGYLPDDVLTFTDDRIPGGIGDDIWERRSSAAASNIISISVDTALAGTPTNIGNHSIYPVPIHSSLQLEADYLYCGAKIMAIDNRLNWFGYHDDFVPPWSFEHLYKVARDLCNRALDAEQRVFTLLQLYETAKKDEFLAAQAAELAGAQLIVAEARIDEHGAANALAIAQANLSLQQAAAQSKKSAAASLKSVFTYVGAAAAFVSGVVLTATGAGAPVGVPLVMAGVSAVGAKVSVGNSISARKKDKEILETAANITGLTLIHSIASLTVAVSERDVAALRAQQATEFLSFLIYEQTLNKQGYVHLLELAREVAEIYRSHAIRLSWQAQRALEHETRKTFDLVDTAYDTGDELTDMTQAQRLTADLEMLRSNYVAGQTQRLQEIKWTIALSQLDTIAWLDLRETGSGTFVLRQYRADMTFPGCHHWRLKDVSVAIIGLVPPEGVRGHLENSGVSYVRVPATDEFLDGETEPDWTTVSLADSANFDPYDGYVMKQVVSNTTVVSLSQFDVRSDRAVLSSPQGMLTPVEHLGLDSAWTLKLHRHTNTIDFLNIVDVEFTFSFLCAYDPALEAAQVNALIEDGEQGRLTGASVTAFAIHQPDAWLDFVREPANGEALDVRLLSVDVGNLPLWETQRKLKNILLACTRAESQTSEITLRLLCDHDPVGYKLTTTEGAIYSLLGVDTSSEDPPPEPDADFEAWIDATFYTDGDTGRVPDKDPEVRWVIKADRPGRGWLETDEDGDQVLTSAGPLQGSNDSAAPGVARYRDGTEWTDVAFEVKVASRSGTLRLRLRDDGTDHYACEISPSSVRLLKWENGALTELATRPLAYPGEEYLCISFSVVGHSLGLQIDGITIFDEVDGDPTSGRLEAGTIALEVVSTDGPTPVDFDDVWVKRLTGLGAEAETLLSEPFTGALPADWDYVNGTAPWSISPERHRRLDLSPLLNIVLNIEYIHKMKLN